MPPSPTSRKFCPGFSWSPLPAQAARPCGALGARLSTLWRYLEATPEPSLWGVVVDGGKSLLGGLAAA